MDPVDILAIGAHPDDVEFAMGGTLVLHHRMGYRIGVVDLTRAELGSKGTPERREQEAEAAAAVYGAAWRANLDLGDNQVVDDPATARRLAMLIRQARPALVFTHHGEDRHPDHRGAFALTRRAVFAAALRKLDLGVPYHVVSGLLFYPSNELMDPDLVVDVTDAWDQREEAMRRYTSQFVEPTLDIDHKYFGVQDYLEATRARARHYGQQIGARYGEGFACQDGVRVDDLVQTFGRPS